MGKNRLTEKDLMIGDYVFYTLSQNYKKVMSTFDMDEACLYEPINLTDDILEKNGFIHINDEYDAWYLDKFELRVREPYEGKNEYEFNGIIIRYVHELQHLMKLCGKKIKL